MLYAMLVCGAFVLFYTLFRCFKRYKKVQMEKTAMEINERYFKYGVENQILQINRSYPSINIIYMNAGSFFECRLMFDFKRQEHGSVEVKDVFRT